MTTQLLIPLMLVLSISAVSARPCKILFISSYSFAVTRAPVLDRNPSNLIYVDLPSSDTSVSSSSGGFLTIFTSSFTSSTQFDTESGFPFNHRHFPKRGIEIQQTGKPPRDSFSKLRSFQDRSRDILSVVIALLFGVGCGALTAATMYLAWSLFSSDHVDYLLESDDDFEYEASPKKMGYVKVPAIESSADPSKA